MNGHSAYRFNQMRNIAELRSQKTFNFKQPPIIPIQDYKTMGFSTPNAYNPPSIQTAYPVPTTHILPKQRITSFSGNIPTNLKAFSYNA